MMYKDALREILNRVYRNTDDCEMRISKDCYKLIREALEKQIPKKPINEECYYICPRCRGDLGVSDDDIFIYKEEIKEFGCMNFIACADVREVKDDWEWKPRCKGEGDA